MKVENNPEVCLKIIKLTKNESLPAVTQVKTVSGDLVSKQSTPDVNDHDIEIESVTTQEQYIDNDADKSQISSSTKPKKFNLLADYSAYSTIHGVRYFSDSQRHWSER